MGVALAQTGPEGTMMMFSVNSEIAQGGTVAADYFWVIEREKGSPVKIPVKMAKRASSRPP